MDIKFDEDCVMFNKTLGKCIGINAQDLKKGHGCDKCAFRKTQAEYIRQMGHTYEEEMKEVEKYVSRNKRQRKGLRQRT